MIVGLCGVGGLFGLIGCSAVAHGHEGAALAASFLPLEVGALWRYAITRDDGRRGEGVVSVDGVDYVESVTDQVSVPAGTFTCLRLRRTQKHHPPLVSWYAKGVGLVKQQGAGPLGDQELALTATRRP